MMHHDAQMEGAKFPMQPFTKEMAKARTHNCEAKAALYGYEYEPSVPSALHHRQGKAIQQRGVREAPFATDSNAPQQRAPAPQNREAPFALHDNYAAPPRRIAPKGEVRAAPFATYDSAVTGNAYADYERQHDVKSYPAEAYPAHVPIPRAPVNERPFAVYDVDARENYPANYTPKGAAREVNNPKITEAPRVTFDSAEFEARQNGAAANARYHGVRDAPFAMGGNFDSAPQGGAAYQARARNHAMDGAANSGAKITGNGNGFNPNHYAAARAENARIQDEQWSRKYVGAGKFLEHP